MKQYVCLFFILMVSHSVAQNPSIVKAFPSGTPEYPTGLSQKQWQNNKWNNLCFYQCTGSNPSKLAVTDGTTAGTKYIADIGTGNIRYTFPAQDFMYLIMTNGDIYKSDGTTAGTQLVATAVCSSFTYSTGIYNYSIIGNVLFFGGYDVTNGTELWKTDGTTTGTVLVKDIYTGTTSSNPGAFCKVGNEVLFRADASGLPGKLWKTDGTEAGTVQILVPEPFNFVNWDGVTINNKMIFFGSGVNHFEPYVSDGTAAGTFMLKDINPTGRSLPSSARGLHFKKNSKYVFFIANDGTSQGLWRTDGTVDGTIKLNNYDNAISDPIYSDVDESGIWYFNNTSGSETIIKSDGTVAGSLVGPANISYGQNMKIFKNACFFAARDFGSLSNIEVWRSDITIPNTNKAFEIAPSANYSSDPKGFFTLNNKLYFFAKDFDPLVGQTLNLYQYDANFTFTGGVAGNRWRDSANWASAMPPGITDTVFINGVNPNINMQKAYAGVLNIAAGSTINFTNSNDSLIVNNSVSANNNVLTGDGVLALRNFVKDTAKINGNLTVNNLAIQSQASVIGENLTINNNLNFANDSRLTLNENNITLSGNTSSITNYNATNYVLTNNTGRLFIENIGTGNRTTSQVFPIGTSQNFNPVTITNTGTSDIFGARVKPTLHGGYIGETPNNSFYSASAVDASWYITEGTSGGSNVDLTLQWNASQELSGFDRTQSYLGHYTSGSWNLGTSGAATGSDPYTFSRTGITSFSPFGIMNYNATLPLTFISFTAQKCNNNNVCLNWKTANEQNVSHFEIERSLDGRNFITIKGEPAKNQPLNLYSSTDDVSNITASKVYYRIKQIDADNKSTLSNIQAVSLNRTAEITLYPNPATDIVSILGWQYVSSVQVFDVSGKLVLQPYANFSGMDISGLPKGLYTVKVIKKDGEAKHMKFIKQ